MDAMGIEGKPIGGYGGVGWLAIFVAGDKNALEIPNSSVSAKPRWHWEWR